MHFHVCSYVPKFILDNIAKYHALHGEDVDAARASIQVSNLLRQNRQQSTNPQVGTPAPASSQPSAPAAPASNAGSAPSGGGVAVAAVTWPTVATHARLIYDGQNQYNYDVTDVRNEGDPAVAAAQARILARAGTVPQKAPQTVRGTAKAQGII